MVQVEFIERIVYTGMPATPTVTIRLLLEEVNNVRIDGLRQVLE
jgi:hypothetical protein